MTSDIAHFAIRNTATTGTGSVYPTSYYRQASVPTYSNSLPSQQQLTRQMSSNYPMTPTISPNSTTSNVNLSSSSSSPAPSIQIINHFTHIRTTIIIFSLFCPCRISHRSLYACRFSQYDAIATYT